MKNSEIKELTTAEIVERIEMENNNLDKMKMNHVISPIENPLLIKQVRRVVARLKTELNARKKQNV